MSLLAPAALALLALAGPLLVLYMLRTRRQRHVVPSVMLWQDAGLAVSSAIPWQRLRLTAVLALQLLLLGIFAFALARPFFAQEALLGPHTVLVIDTSGSMAMAARVEAAKERATGLVADASAANLVSVVEAGPVPRVVASFSRDPTGLTQAIASLEPTGGVEDLAGAIRLARGLATPDRPTSILLLSDGGPPGEAPIEEPVVGVRHLLFNSWDANLAVTALNTDTPGEGMTRLFLETSNFGHTTQGVMVQVAVNGLPVAELDLELAGSARARRTLPVEAAPGDLITAALVGHQDALPLDDAAALVLGGGPDRTAAIVGEGSMFMQALVEAAPGFSLAQGEAPDLAIIDRQTATIDRPTWLIRPSAPPSGVRVTGLVENAVVTYQRPGEPLLEGVDLSDLAVAEAEVVDAPGWLPLVRAGEAPLVLLGEVDGHRVAYFTFDITHSNLPVQVAFPILGSRLLEWLAGGATQTGVAAPAGTPIALAAPPQASIEVLLPEGDVVSLPAGTTLFGNTGLPGVYQVTYRLADGTTQLGPVAVRQFAPQESAGGFRRLVNLSPQAGETERGSLIREQAPLLVGLLVAVGLLEWWVAHQRPWPRRRRVFA